MIAKTKKSYNDHLFKNHQCKLLRVVEQKPRRPNSIVVVYYKLVVVQSGARVGDYLPQEVTRKMSGVNGHNTTTCGLLTESNPAGAARRLLSAEVRILPFPTATRLRNIALYGDPGAAPRVYVSDLYREGRESDDQEERLIISHTSRT